MLNAQFVFCFYNNRTEDFFESSWFHFGFPMSLVLSFNFSVTKKGVGQGNHYLHTKTMTKERFEQQNCMRILAEKQYQNRNEFRINVFKVPELSLSCLTRVPVTLI